MSNNDGAPPIPPPPPGDDARATPPPPPSGPTEARPNPYATAEGPAAPPPPPAYGAAPGAPAPATPGKGMAITALVLGIIALLGVAIPVLNIGSLIMAIVGLILGFVALNKYTASKGLPISAVIVSAIATLLSLVFVVLYTIGFVAFLQEAESEGIFEPVPSASPAPELTDEPDAGGTDEPGAGEDDGIDLDFGAVQTPESGPGSADEPFAIGETVTIEVDGVPTWELTVDTVELNGTDRVLASNDLNEPPTDGLQYAVVALTATNIGEFSADPWFDIEIAYADTDGNLSRPFDHSATSPEPSWIGVGSTETGGTLSGNTVILVPIAEPESGRWLVYSYFDETGYYFQAQ